MKTLTIATRASDLALWQAYFVKDEIEKKFPDIKVELNKITSRGDKILDKPLALIGGKGHFTKELEDEMLAGNADMAVHSLKDVPTFIPEGLELAAITKREDQSDVFLSHKYKSFEELPKNAVVGTTSLRRRMQIKAVRSDLVMKDLRGNVNTRLRKLKEGRYDAIVLAYIGLKRLDLLKDIPYVQKLPLDMMTPPMGQAALGIEIVSSNEKVKEIALSLNDEDTAICTKIERDFVKEIGAGCSAPVSVNARVKDDNIVVKAMVGFPDGTHILKEHLMAPKKEYKSLGLQIAERLKQKGAIEVLKEAEKMAFKDDRAERL
jgi:hydroxymethylbilane synthase